MRSTFELETRMHIFERYENKPLMPVFPPFDPLFLLSLLCFIFLFNRGTVSRVSSSCGQAFLYNESTLESHV